MPMGGANLTHPQAGTRPFPSTHLSTGGQAEGGTGIRRGVVFPLGISYFVGAVREPPFFIHNDGQDIWGEGNRVVGCRKRIRRRTLRRPMNIAGQSLLLRLFAIPGGLETTPYEFPQF